MDRRIQEALIAAHDHASASLWRRICRDLQGELQVGVLLPPGGPGRRLTERLLSPAGVTWVRLHPEDLTALGQLGTQDRVLSCHALLCATPWTSALTAGDRERLATLDTLGATHHRAVVLVGRKLLEQMSDHPAAEALEVRQRVEALIPPGWSVLDEGSVEAWLIASEAQRHELATRQRRRVGQLLLREALARCTREAEATAQRLHQARELLAQEDQHLEEARRQGQRVANHVLSASRRATEQLLIDLRQSLQDLEGELQRQVAAVPRLEQARRALPHWLHQVIEHWLRDRLARWRLDVLEDLQEIGLADQEAAQAELLVPGLHPPPVRKGSGWGHRLGTTAALGGGAALLLAGLWIPGALVFAGGFAWSALGRSAAQADNQRDLVRAGQEALRAMGQDAERLLSDQLEQLEAEISSLSGAQAKELAAQRASARAELEGRLREHEQAAREHATTAQQLTQHLHALLPPDTGSTSRS